MPANDVPAFLAAAVEPHRNTSSERAAVALGLMDAMLEMADLSGRPPATITVADLANRMMALYWQQVRRHVKAPDGLLRQSEARITRVTQIVWDARRLTAANSPDVAAMRNSEVWYRSVRALSAHLVAEVLGGMQSFGMPHDKRSAFLFDDTPYPAERITPERAAVMPIALRAGVPELLVAQAPALRPMVTDAWFRVVAALNTGANDANLERFLFGTDVATHARTLQSLQGLQTNHCGLCGDRMIGDAVVDHAIPRAWTGNDGLANLIAVHSGCTRDRGAAVLGIEAVHRWLDGTKREWGLIFEIAEDLQSPVRIGSTFAGGRAVYRHLPDGYPVWQGRGRVVPLDAAMREELVGLLVVGDDEEA